MAATGLRESPLVRWAVVAAILAAAAVVVTALIIRAIPSEGVAQVEIAGWRAPVGVVVSTDDVKSRLPGLIVGSILGEGAAIQINAGRVEQVDSRTVTIRSFVGGKSTEYSLSGSTRILDARNPLVQRAPSQGDSVAIVTSPGSHEALVLLTGVSLVSR